ncbi:MAG TPA: hypothetical protein VGE55_13240 [Limnobacter sp.]|uniref:hypothetical protein n=1 Tax=Limnobacter sp. TaxID=2003368 RepID=UPI002ED964CB
MSPDLLSANLSSNSILNTGSSSAPISTPSSADVSLFNQAVSAPPVTSTPVKEAVGQVQTSYESQLNLFNSRVKSFRGNLDVGSLISMMWESSTTSVGLQLVSKASSKGTESFESLLKQQ